MLFMPEFMIVRMFVRMIGPVLVYMSVHHSKGWKFIHLMGVCALQMMVMIVTAPEVLRIVVGNQQAFAMMPASTEDVIILLALCCALVVTEAIPFTMWVLLDALNRAWSRQDAIAGGFEEETVVDVHQAIEAETLVDPADFWQQTSPEGHQVALNGIHIGSGGLVKLAQVFGHQPVWSHDSHIAVGQRGSQWLPDIARDFDRGIHQDNEASPAGAHGCIASSGKAHVVIGKEYLQGDAPSMFARQIVMTRKLL